MPTNVSPEYLKAQQNYEEAKTQDSKIRYMNQMITHLPKHKGTEKLLKQLKRRLAKLKFAKEEDEKRKKGGYSLFVRKIGFQIVIIGYPNSGKSTLLKELTNADPKIAAYAYTTKKPEVGMINHGGAQVQLVEIPAIVKNANEKQRELLGIVSSADGIILLYKNEQQKRILVGELHEFNIEKPIMMAEFKKPPTAKNIFNFFDLIRVYTKEPGKDPVADKPLVFKRGATIVEAAKEVHKDFAKKLKYARVWGSSRFKGQRVEQDYILKDKDVVEFHI